MSRRDVHARGQEQTHEGFNLLQYYSYVRRLLPQVAYHARTNKRASNEGAVFPTLCAVSTKEVQSNACWRCEFLMSPIEIRYFGSNREHSILLSRRGSVAQKFSSDILQNGGVLVGVRWTLLFFVETKSSSSNYRYLLPVFTLSCPLLPYERYWPSLLLVNQL
jgi:hypothetical protein